MNIALTALLLVSAGAQAPKPQTPTLANPGSLVRTVTWDDVHSYIVAHAAPMDYETEGLLQDEAEAGVKTWSMVGQTGGGVPSFRGFTFDGPGVGWPAANHVLRFPTTGERNFAAGLIDQFTANRSPRH